MFKFIFLHKYRLYANNYLNFDIELNPCFAVKLRYEAWKHSRALALK